MADVKKASLFGGIKSLFVEEVPEMVPSPTQAPPLPRSPSSVAPPSTTGAVDPKVIAKLETRLKAKVPSQYASFMEQYMVLDEPTTGLDPVMKDRVCELIKKVANTSEENTLFVVTHDIPAILSIADTIWVMGRKRDAQGVSLGASILYTYDLIERGIAWHPAPTQLSAFDELSREILSKFQTL